MYYSISNKSCGYLAAWTFLKRRFFRVWPAYCLATLLFLFVLVSLTSYELENKLFVLKSLLLLPVFDEVGKLRPLLGVGWTLVYEAYFYIIVAAVLVVPGKLYVWKLLVLLASLATAGWMFSFKDLYLKFFTDPLLLEFLFGVFVAYMFINSRPIDRRLARVLAALSVGLLMSSVILYGDLERYRILAWGLPAAGLVFSVVGCSARSCVSPLVFLGEISYSLYLTHAILFFCCNSIWKRGFSGADVDSNLMILVLFLLAIPAGYGFYRFVERPMIGRFC